MFEKIRQLPNPIEVLQDPVSLIVIGIFLVLLLVEALWQPAELSMVPLDPIRGGRAGAPERTRLTPARREPSPGHNPHGYHGNGVALRARRRPGWLL